MFDRLKKEAQPSLGRNLARKDEAENLKQNGFVGSVIIGQKKE